MSGITDTPHASLVERYFGDLMNAGDLGVADEILAPDLAFYGSETVHGLEPFKQFVTRVHAAFPDLQITVEDAFGAGNKTVARWTLRCTHQGEFHGIPATRNTINITGADFLQIRDGRIMEIRVIFDSLGFMRQLGVIPEAAHS